jgi:hypothetical protein
LKLLVQFSSASRGTKIGNIKVARKRENKILVLKRKKQKSSKIKIKFLPSDF